MTQPSAAASNESLIAQEDTFEGNLKTATGVRVLGTVRGSIESQRSVRIEEGAHVEADITAEEVVIAGTYQGNLDCRNRVEITSSGRVSGKLDTVKLHLHEGGFFDGELHMQRPEDAAARPTDGEGQKPRRSRYVDINSESPKASNEGAPETGKNGESTS
jgi:cytoskeletal protein CcmA (bactofilin family)